MFFSEMMGKSNKTRALQYIQSKEERLFYSVLKRMNSQALGEKIWKKIKMHITK